MRLTQLMGVFTAFKVAIKEVIGLETVPIRLAIVKIVQRLA
jgi:hypothetical protein